MAAPEVLDPRWRSDPSRLYQQLRDEAPVHWSPALRMWVISRYDDVLAALQGSDYSVERFSGPPAAEAIEPPAMTRLRSILRYWAVYRDPPAHRRLRELLAPSFITREIEAMRPLIESVVEDLLDRVSDLRRFDFIADFAFPLPANVVARMLGVPERDLEKVRLWSERIAAYLGGAQAGQRNADTAQQGLLEACDYFRRLVEVRRRHPGGDVLSRLIATGEEGNRLDADELVSNCVLLLFAGHETTANLLGNGLYHLLRNPRELARLRRDPELTAPAIEEFLRIDPPVAGTIRIARRDLVRRGAPIRGGQSLAVMIAAANRDPRHFSDPERLDLSRSPNHHLAFGHGIHFCLGAPLARLEARIAFRALLARFSRLQADVEDPHWKPQVFFRGLSRLDVEVAP